MTVHICRGPEMEEIRRDSEGERWCFHCRARREFFYVVTAPIEPSYYGPNISIRCGACDLVDGDLFPGGYRRVAGPAMKRTPLARKTPMRRTAMKRGERTVTRSAHRDTGPTSATKDALWIRARGRCEICGRDLSTGQPFSRHHRRSRGAGGSSVEWVNLLSNLLLVCGSATSPGGCHEHVENNAQEAYDAGWRIRRNGGDYLPHELPVLIFAPVSLGRSHHRLVYLDNLGNYVPGSP